MNLRFVFVVYLMVFYGVTAAPALTPQQVARTALASTVLIEGENDNGAGHGSGFVIGAG